MNLTNDQRKSIESGEAVPVVIDHLACVILREDVFDRVRSLLEEELNEEELRAIFARGIESSDWLDPVMDVYDEYDKHKP